MTRFCRFSKSISTYLTWVWLVSADAIDSTNGHFMANGLASMI
jgi:hypothetical protein